MSDLDAAKKLLLEALGDQPWLTGVGIGLVGMERRKGLIISLDSQAPTNARERIADLIPGVAFQVRGFPGARKRNEP